jgi:hypothetical protein
MGPGSVDMVGKSKLNSAWEAARYQGAGILDFHRDKRRGLKSLPATLLHAGHDSTGYSIFTELA